LRSAGFSLRACRMYFWIVRLHTRMSSLISSPLFARLP
jgi:hypothetical protein